MKRIATLALSLLALSCSPQDWAVAKGVGSTVGAAVDTFALVRAEQIRQSSAAAIEAAEKGDPLGAQRELNEALASIAASTFQELRDARAENARLRAQCAVPVVASSAPPATEPSDAGAPDAP